MSEYKLMPYDKKTSKDRLSKRTHSKKDSRTMPPLHLKYPEKLRDAKKVEAMDKALKKKMREC